MRKNPSNLTRIAVLLVVAGMLLMVAAAQAQQAVNNRPDAEVPFSLTAATTGTSGARPIQIDNRFLGCNNFTFTYANDTNAAVSIRMDEAAAVSGVPGSWSVFGTAIGALSSGTVLPLTNTTAGQATGGLNVPFVSINLVSLTGTGPVTGKLMCWKPQAAQDASSTSGATVSISQKVFVSVLNQSSAQLLAGATFTGTYESTTNVVLIQPNVFGDQGPYTINVDQCAVQSCAAPNHTDTWTSNGTAADPFGNFQVGATSSFYRVRVTNTGAGTTTTFRVDTFLTPVGVPGFSNPYPAFTPIPSTAVENGHILLARAGTLYGLVVTSTVNGLVMVFNSATVPGNGAVTPIYCLRLTPDSGGAGTFGINFIPGPGAAFSTGISWAMSTGTNCASLTLSATAWGTGIAK